MRRFKVYTRKIGSPYWYEAARFWTRNGAERWAVANQDKVFDYFKVDTQR